MNPKTTLSPSARYGLVARAWVDEALTNRVATAAIPIKQTASRVRRIPIPPPFTQLPHPRAALPTPLIRPQWRARWRHETPPSKAVVVLAADERTRCRKG